MDSFKLFVALLALVNPLGAVPIFISLTEQHTRAERKKTIVTAAISVGVVIVVSGILGEQIIDFFGISIGSLQVGGGLIILLTALNMLNAKAGGARSTPEEESEAETKPNIGVVPLAIPFMTGPGAISTVIVYAHNMNGWLQYLGLLLAAVAMAALVMMALSMAGRIARLLGQTGINVATRLMGLILSALAVEIIANGLIRLLPALAAGA
ncbi:MAG: MarC family protein [Burkholderiaceae bacterium]